MQRPRIRISVLMARDPTVITANTLIDRQIHQSTCLHGLWIIRMVLEIRDQCHDAVQGLMLPWPAPMPRLKVPPLGQPQEAMHVFTAVHDHTKPSSLAGQWEY